MTAQKNHHAATSIIHKTYMALSRLLCACGFKHTWKIHVNQDAKSSTRVCIHCGCFHVGDLLNQRIIYREPYARYNPLGSMSFPPVIGKSRFTLYEAEARLLYAFKNQHFYYYSLTMFDLYDALEGKTIRIAALFDSAQESLRLDANTQLSLKSEIAQ